MTTMGIQYLEYLEKERANRAQERIKQDTLEETKRSNMANESLKWQSIQEEHRSNVANEGIKEQTRQDNYDLGVANAHIKWDEKEISREANTIKKETAAAQEINKFLGTYVKAITDILDTVWLW